GNDVQPADVGDDSQDIMDVRVLEIQRYELAGIDRFQIGSLHDIAAFVEQGHVFHLGCGRYPDRVDLPGLGCLLNHDHPVLRTLRSFPDRFRNVEVHDEQVVVLGNEVGDDLFHGDVE